MGKYLDNTAMLNPPYYASLWS